MLGFRKFRFTRPTNNKDTTQMMKRLLLAAIMMISTTGMANLAVANVPFPGCYPCPPQPERLASANLALPADAR